MKTPTKITPACEILANPHFRFGGFVGKRIDASIDQWLLPAPKANPGMLQMFRDRDWLPRREIVFCAGEYVGKYLTSAAQTYRITEDTRLKARIDEVINDLHEVQDVDGYLGPFPKSERLTGKCFGKDWTGWPLWDLWGHYHIMLGLVLWYRQTGDTKALTICTKTADYICSRFLDTGERPISAGAEEMNLAVAHAFCLLYEITGKEPYLRMAREIEKDWQTSPAGDYVRTALAGKEFYETPKPRWESLPDIQAIAELYFITGDKKYRDAFEHIWWSIVKGDRHNTGGFSSGEQATGNLYDPRAIETCCTIAWMALSVDMLRITGDSKVADELELSTFNGMLGAQTPSGRWWTYNTPMDGARLATVQDIIFQAHRGSPELNCCSVNGPRGLGLLGEWAVMRSEDGIALNYYGPMTAEVAINSKAKLTITQETTYPVNGKVRITLKPSRPSTFALKLRIPYWSAKTRLFVNSERVKVKQGTYCTIERRWKKGDTIELALDMSLHWWAGEKECKGRASCYRGPILLTYDQRYNETDPDNIPALDVASLKLRPMKWTKWPVPWVLFRCAATDGSKLILCDFASAGAAGTLYRSWLPVIGVKKQAFLRENPLRTRRFSHT